MRRTYWKFDDGEHLHYGNTRFQLVDRERDATLIGSLLDDQAGNFWGGTPITAEGDHAPALDMDFAIEKVGRNGVRFHRDVSVGALRSLLAVLREFGVSATTALAGSNLKSSGAGIGAVGGTLPVAVSVRTPIEFVRNPEIEFSVPVKIRPSRTRGHFHLFIDAKLSWEKYRALLDALKAVNFIEEKFHQMAMERRITLLFLPGAKAQLEEKLGRTLSS